jgi:hypothetical protein
LIATAAVHEKGHKPRPLFLEILQGISCVVTAILILTQTRVVAGITKTAPLALVPPVIPPEAPEPHDPRAHPDSDCFDIPSEKADTDSSQSHIGSDSMKLLLASNSSGHRR